MSSSHCSRSPRCWGMFRAGHGQRWEAHRKRRPILFWVPHTYLCGSVVRAFVPGGAQLILLDFQVYLVQYVCGGVQVKAPPAGHTAYHAWLHLLSLLGQLKATHGGSHFGLPLQLKAEENNSNL